MREYRQECVNMLTGYGIGQAEARRLVRSGELPVPLDENTLKNLKLLSEHMDLGCVKHWVCLLMFLKRDYAINLEMEQLGKLCGLPEELRKQYLSDPLGWSVRERDLELAEEGLRLLTGNDRIVLEILYAQLVRGAYIAGEDILRACRCLEKINAMPERMEEYLEKYHFILFSMYSDVPLCVDELIGLVGAENALAVLLEYPDLPRSLSHHHGEMNRERCMHRLKEALQVDGAHLSPLPMNVPEELWRLVEATKDTSEGASVRAAVDMVYETGKRMCGCSMEYIMTGMWFQEDGESLRAVLELLSRCGAEYGIEIPNGEKPMETREYLLRLVYDLIGIE